MSDKAIFSANGWQTESALFDLILRRLKAVPMTTPKIEYFSGWKEIANYLGKGVRTVQRYEGEMGLPIHRPARKSSAAVVAIQSELDNWVTTGSSRVDSIPRRRVLNAQTNRLRANFLQIDSEIALTFSGMALEASDREKKRRTTLTARKAYDTIMRMRDDVDSGDAEKNRLDANLRRKRSVIDVLTTCGVFCCGR